MFLDEYEKELKEISESEDLLCLADFEQLKFDGKNSLDFLHLISKTRNELNADGKFDLLAHDLVHSVSPNVKFSLSNVLLYAPLSNNFVEEINNSGGKKHATYFRNKADARFFYYINATFEKLYNFWDRIGDILAMSFNLSLPDRKVYFSTVIDELSKQNIRSDSFIWLKTFKKSDYASYLNRLRINIVHYRQKDSYFFFEWLNSINKDNHLEIVTKLQKEKDELPTLLKEQLDIANKGFEHMILLIAEHGIYESD